jgi:hypothetical protein
MADAPLHKPLPEITDQTRPFWTAAKHGRFVLQRCPRCATFNFYPKPWCIECGSRGLEWVDAQPCGTVYSHTVSRTVGMNYPGWKDDLPVVMCIIDLDDGARMYGQVTGCPPESVHIGMRVGVHFEDISADAAIPKFHPIEVSARDER